MRADLIELVVIFELACHGIGDEEGVAARCGVHGW
jgi:hypothetical protein